MTYSVDRWWKKGFEPPAEEEAPPAHIAYAAQVLNEALAAEPAVVQAMLRVAMPISAALDSHPSIQVDLYERPGGTGGRWLSVFGLVNGLLGADEQGMPRLGVKFIEDIPGLRGVEGFGYIPAAERKRMQGRRDEQLHA